MPSFVRYMHMLSRYEAQFLDDRMVVDGNGIKGCHSKYVIEVCKNPGISQDKLAKQLLVNKSNVARQLASLEESGFVERKVSESDARQLLVYPTEKAEEIFPKLRKANFDWKKIINEGLSDEEKEQLLNLTEKLYENAARYMGKQD